MTLSGYKRPPLKVALMGLGRAMMEEHYPILLANPDLFRVVCACDLVKERRDVVGRDFPDCRMYRRFEDMLDESYVELVVVATCSVDHVAHALMSLKKGFWTVLESPMALTAEDATVLKGAAVKAKNRLVVVQRGFFEPDFVLASKVMSDSRLGAIHQIRIRREDYVRRDDWQCVKRLGGGAAYYAMPDMILQALKLLPFPPVQMWSELKRIASLGDSEDYARVSLRTREQISADVEFSGGVLPANRSPSFVISGERGSFKVAPGASEGVLDVIDPGYRFERRRASVRTPRFRDMHEEFPVVSVPVALENPQDCGLSGFWRRVYDSIRTAAPLPLSLEDSIEAVKFAHLMKKTSQFGK